VICNSTSIGFVQIVGTAPGVVIVGGSGCIGNTIGGDLVANDNRGGVEIVGNQINEDLIVRHNSQPVTVNNNSVSGQTLVVPPTYNALPPARILDTRSGQLVGDGFEDKIPPATTIDVQILGRGGVPLTDVSSVVLNVTFTETTDTGHAVLWPTGTAKPNTSNLNWVAGQTVANLVLVKVGGNGKVSIYNSAGASHIIFDVEGFIPTGTDFGSLNGSRILDTRAGELIGDGFENAIGPDQTISFQVTGRGGVPSGGVRAVVINVTATQSTQPSYLTISPTGEARPNASNVNFAAGQTVPNLVVAKLGNNGRINIYNSIGLTHVIIDVVGWMPLTTDYGALTPARILDTRPGFAPDDGMDVPLGPGATRDVLVLGRGGVPTTGVGAVVINVTVVNGTAPSFLTLWPTGTARPTASNLNFGPGQTVANLAIVPVGTDGKISVFNSSGNVDVIFDIQGWFPPA
jgi:hypothetical protein